MGIIGEHADKTARIFEKVKGNLGIQIPCLWRDLTEECPLENVIVCPEMCAREIKHIFAGEF
jgi:hypothetical protein